MCIERVIRVSMDHRSMAHVASDIVILSIAVY